MKITAFEVREDERPFFEKLARDQHLDLVLCPDPLNMKNLRMLTDSAGTVSYTHLDVYKRQYLYCLHAGYRYQSF